MSQGTAQSIRPPLKKNAYFHYGFIDHGKGKPFTFSLAKISIKTSKKLKGEGNHYQYIGIIMVLYSSKNYSPYAKMPFIVIWCLVKFPKMLRMT